MLHAAPEGLRPSTLGLRSGGITRSRQALRCLAGKRSSRKKHQQQQPKEEAPQVPSFLAQSSSQASHCRQQQQQVLRPASRQAQVAEAKAEPIASTPEDFRVSKPLESSSAPAETRSSGSSGGSRPPARRRAEPLSASAPPLLPGASDGMEVPQSVSDRVLRRILAFAGVPVALGVLLLPAFWYLKVKQQVDIPMWAVQLSTVFTFGAGFLGISYGALSSSWREKPGSLWGFNEAKENLDALQKKDKR